MAAIGSGASARALAKAQSIWVCRGAVSQLTCGAAVYQRRSENTLTAYKRGRGGRSSFSGIVATVFGASGFLGRYVVTELGKIGSQVIVPYRGDAYDVAPLKLCGDLGQIVFQPYYLKDEDSIRKAVQHSNVVINLIGRDWETRNFSFDDVHVKYARQVARIARECKVEKLIHFSAMNASTEPKPVYLPKGSQFLASKARGEEAVREEFPDAIIFRPADMFGAEDRFLQYYASRWRREFGFMPLWKRGTATVKQPVYVSDVSAGVVKAVMDKDAAGKTFECVGPNSYYLSDLVDYFYRCLRWSSIIRVPILPTFWIRSKIMSLAPASPIFTDDRVEREFVSDVLTSCPTLEDLCMKKLTRLEDRAPYDLKPMRLYNYYQESLGEFPDPAPPPTAAQVDAATGRSPLQL